MRIRKHAKLTGSSLIPQDLLPETHVCQLNQSPWDVIHFPTGSSSTPEYKVDKDSSFTGNGSFADSIGAVESTASMKISLEEEKETKEDDGPNHKREDHLGIENNEAILCSKSDGKGWQCWREAKEDHSLCEHHFTQLRNYNNLAHPGRRSGKSSEKDVAISRHPRTKKGSSVSNRHEFYYYSGFGPRWGKKRGTIIEPNVSSDPKLIVTNVSSDTKLVVEPITKVTTKSSALQIDDAEFDYVGEDDYDDDQDESSEARKKRGRKPIKARSLKSLM
ncbi:uncharacterized protein LOC132302338 [Cornus florida]|uniref:uncharacterized protein LOC132302338 n=1 Tax=Cornus florida TaxID=4283 RepID=UPI002899FA22|nr:uncharacterized protein LOC132302338 [Cornus florida]